VNKVECPIRARPTDTRPGPGPHCSVGGPGPDFWGQPNGLLTAHAKFRGWLGPAPLLLYPMAST
jgi:hypothetical protein